MAILGRGSHDALCPTLARLCFLGKAAPWASPSCGRARQHLVPFRPWPPYTIDGVADRIRVLIVDAAEEVGSLAATLTAHSQIDLVGSASTMQEALAATEIGRAS